MVSTRAAQPSWLANRRVSVLGLAFKKDTDDVRQAASIRVIAQLVKKGAKVYAYDPMATRERAKSLPRPCGICRRLQVVPCRADCCTLMTEWHEFRKLRPAELRSIYEVA